MPELDAEDLVELDAEDSVDGFPHVSSDDQLYRGPGDHLRYEQYRLETFSNWPRTANVDKIDLARNGFYYLGDGDRVKCVFCNVILKSWDKQDNVAQEHQKHAPMCPFLKNSDACGNIPYHRVISSEAQLLTPKYKEYKDREVRLKSFNGWPSDKKQTPEQLACAGFFYLGSADAVKCFFCGGMLRSWDDPDVPWEEHKNWFPTCPFVIQNDAKCQKEQKINRKMSMSKIAIKNGYDRDLLEYHKKYTEENQIPYPENYEDLVDELENLRLSQEHVTVGATGFTPSSETSEVFVPSGRSPREVQQQEPNQPKSSHRKSTIQSQWSVDERFQCKICMENPVEVIFLPCRHVCCCQNCANKLRVQECPICRSKIKGVQPLYFA